MSCHREARSRPPYYLPAAAQSSGHIVLTLAARCGRAQAAPTPVVCCVSEWHQRPFRPVQRTDRDTTPRAALCGMHLALDEHRRHRHNHAHRLWSVLVLQS